MEIELTIRKILQNERERLEFLRKELAVCPKGDLYCQTKNGRPYYFLCRRQNGRLKHTGVNRKPDVLNGAIRRRLLEPEMASLQANIRVLEGVLCRLDRFDLTSACEDLKRRFPGLTDERISDALRAADGSDWAKEPYDQSDYRSEERRHVTSRGLRVRSKSEVMIAEQLYAQGLPFRYEQVITAARSVIVPDFTIRRRDGKIMYWEHEGLMSDPAYAERQYKKNKLYASVGIVPWDNLIITFDDAFGNIDMRIIGSEIANKLLV